MPPPLLESARHAIAGLLCAYRGERNLRLFLLGYASVILSGLLLQLPTGEWFALLLVGALFLCIELLNTALEHLADIVDDHLKAAHCTPHTFEDLKTTKDVAAAASLVSLVVALAVIGVIFWPHLVWFIQ